MKYLLPVLICLGLIWGFGIDTLQDSSAEEDEQFSDRVNLALRHVGHQLLNLKGDSHSPIPPVEITSPSSFKLKLEQSFNYDSLPQLLDQAFVTYDIVPDYHVLVQRCIDDVVILGYNFETYSTGETACKGREQLSECSNIIVTFSEPTQSSPTNSIMLLGFLILAGIGVIGYFLLRTKNIEQKELENNASGGVVPSARQDSLYTVGKFTFDAQNQLLVLGEVKQNLTFRENKLLHHLVQHINEIQTRDKLINEIWADEGVLVGRSLDVFISRLRKLLKADENVSIKSIHGVGYRLELAG